MCDGKTESRRKGTGIMPQVRKSSRRDAVLRNLQSRCDHPTAAELYASVREEIPNISLATLYRNLKALCDEGVILRLSSETEEHYDACTVPHPHLQCEKCGRFYDLPALSSKTAEQLHAICAAEDFDGYNLIFSGVCEQCGRADKK